MENEMSDITPSKDVTRIVFSCNLVLDDDQGPNDGARGRLYERYERLYEHETMNMIEFWMN